MSLTPSTIEQLGAIPHQEAGLGTRHNFALLHKLWARIQQAPIDLDQPADVLRHLGKEILAQSLDLDGQPLRRIPPISMVDPTVSTRHWRKMDANAAVVNVMARMTATEQRGKTRRVPPIVGKFALVNDDPTQPVVHTAEGSTLIIYRRPGEQPSYSHQLRPARARSILQTWRKWGRRP